MDNLFTADLIVNGAHKSFTVSFANDAYKFTASNGAENFSIIRKQDEWHVSGNLPPVSQQQAIHALDQYLLSQH